MELEVFNEIVNRLETMGRLDENGYRCLGHWTYRVEDGGYTQVIVNTAIGVSYYRHWDNTVEVKHHYAATV